MHKMKTNLSPIFILAKVLLISPVCINSYPKLGKLSVISFQLVAILQVIGYFYILFDHFFLWEVSLINTITHINLFISVICCVTMLISAGIYYNRFEQIMEKLEHIDQQTKWNNYKTIKKFMIVCFICWVMNNTTVVIEVSTDQSNNSQNSGLPIMFYIIYTLSGLIAGGFVIIYSTLLLVIQEQFEYTAKKLKQLSEINDTLTIEENLKGLRDLHLDICELVKVINDYLGDSVLVTLAMCFMHLLANLYMAGIIQQCVKQTTHSMGLLVLSIVHCLPDVLIIGILCYRGEKTKKYVRIVIVY